LASQKHVHNILSMQETPSLWWMHGQEWSLVSLLVRVPYCTLGQVGWILLVYNNFLC